MTKMSDQRKRKILDIIERDDDLYANTIFFRNIDHLDVEPDFFYHVERIIEQDRTFTRRNQTLIATLYEHPNCPLDLVLKNIEKLSKKGFQTLFARLDEGQSLEVIDKIPLSKHQEFFSYLKEKATNGEEISKKVISKITKKIFSYYPRTSGHELEILAFPEFVSQIPNEDLKKIIQKFGTYISEWVKFFSKEQFETFFDLLIDTIPRAPLLANPYCPESLIDQTIQEIVWKNFWENYQTIAFLIENPNLNKKHARRILKYLFDEYQKESLEESKKSIISVIGKFINHESTNPSHIIEFIKNSHEVEQFIDRFAALNNKSFNPTLSKIFRKTLGQYRHSPRIFENPSLDFETRKALIKKIEMFENLQKEFHGLSKEEIMNILNELGFDTIETLISNSKNNPLAMELMTSLVFHDTLTTSQIEMITQMNLGEEFMKILAIPLWKQENATTSQKARIFEFIKQYIANNLFPNIYELHDIIETIVKHSNTGTLVFLSTQKFEPQPTKNKIFIFDILNQMKDIFIMENERFPNILKKNLLYKEKEMGKQEISPC